MRSKDESKSVGEAFTKLVEDLVKYGLIPEFVGRLPAVATPVSDEDALIQILSEPKNALVKQYKELFEMEGVELDVRRKRYALFTKAMERKTGARGLRSILETILLRPMFGPSDNDVSKIVIDEGVVTGDSEPLKIYAGAPDKKRSANAAD